MKIWVTQHLTQYDIWIAIKNFPYVLLPSGTGLGCLAAVGNSEAFPRSITIDATHYGDAPWKCFTVSYSGEASQPCPTCQKDIWEVFYRDPDVVLRQMLGKPDFHGQFEYASYVRLDKGGSRIWSDFMSGNFAFRRSV